MTLLKDLLALTKNLNEDDVKPLEGEVANPVSAEAVAPAEPEVKADAATPDSEEKPEVIDEAEEYTDSGEFTDEFYDLLDKVEHLKTVVNGAKFNHWMDVTDTNFSTTLKTLTPALKEALTALETSLKAVEEELNNAG